MRTPTLLCGALLALFSVLPLLAADDPFAPYLTGRAPEILREIADPGTPPEGVTVRRVVIRSREHSEIFAVIATKLSDGHYEAHLPAEAVPGSDWFIVASDDRPVTVSSDFTHLNQ